jgi:hypothetical protein
MGTGATKKRRIPACGFKWRLDTRERTGLQGKTGAERVPNRPNGQVSPLDFPDLRNSGQSPQFHDGMGWDRKAAR